MNKAAVGTRETYVIPITKEQSKRIDIYKAILAIMVVFLHSYQSSSIPTISEMNYADAIQFVISQIICRCAVPSFFFLSSFLLYRKPIDYKSNIKKKIKSLAIPYFIMNTVWILFFLIAGFIPFINDLLSNPANNVSAWEFADYLDAYTGCKDGFPMLTPMWFIRDLFILNVLSVPIGKIVEKLPIVCTIIAIIMWLFIPVTGLFFLQNQSIVFWLSGCIICKKRIDLSTFDKIPTWLTSLLYIGFITADLFTTPYEFNSIIHNLGIVMGMLFWYVCATKIKNVKIEKLILVVSAYNFGIYIFHENALTLFKKVCTVILPGQPVIQVTQYFILPITIISGCIILCMFLKRFLPRIYKILTGSRS